ncbi:MAG: YfaZ family outer membrane protein [Acidobacteriota bacterium]
MHSGFRALGLAAMGLAMSVSAQADQVDFALNNDAFSVNYSSSRLGSGASVDGDWFHHVDRGNVLGLGLKIDQYRGADSVSLGGKLVLVSNDVKDASALALGGAFSVGLPGEPRIRFGGHAWLAPSVTSFGDADGFIDIDLRVGYRVLDRGELYLGYRYINVDYQNHHDLKVQDGLMVGMNLTF